MFDTSLIVIIIIGDKYKTAENHKIERPVNRSGTTVAKDGKDSTNSNRCLGFNPKIFGAPLEHHQNHYWLIALGTFT